MEVNPLMPIGAKVKIDKSKIENLLPNKLLDTLPKQINGEIVDYKMTDGMGIGYVLMTCLLYTSPSPRDKRQSRMPSSA